MNPNEKVNVVKFVVTIIMIFTKVAAITLLADAVFDDGWKQNLFIFAAGAGWVVKVRVYPDEE